MAIKPLAIGAFLELARSHPVLDVRSPAEYAHAHIPGAYSFPLFSDEERRVVGTTYKQQSREAAIKVGLDYFGPKMAGFVTRAEAIARQHHNASFDRAEPSNTLLVHCWRGGMRSAAIAWLLDLYGFKVYSLIGGYKKYRHWVIDTYTQDVPFQILGGYTGSGKTHVLHRLLQQGQPVIDLEHLASHKGSAFGNIGMPLQPSQEYFENLLSTELNRYGVVPGQSYTGAPLWLEDESQRIGLVNIPQVFWSRMRRSRVYFLDIPFEARLDHLLEEYGALDRNHLANAITRIQKRLGGGETRQALEALEQDRLRDCFRILLNYYDRWYRKGLHNREHLDQLLVTQASATVNARINADLISLTSTPSL